MDTAATTRGAAARALAHTDAAPTRASITAFPYISENPYQRLLYESLAAEGLDFVAEPDFKVLDLVRRRRELDVLHFHWPQNYYRWWRRPHVLASALSWLKVGLFGLRLRVARALGLTLVWTIHEVFPHERSPKGVDRAGARLLAHASDLLLSHDAGTARTAETELRVPRDRIEIVPHASFTDVYAPGRPRSEVRAELRIPDNAVVFLCFGHIRAYKAIDVLLDAFKALELPSAVLVVAGLPMDDRVTEAIDAAAAADDRLRPLLGFVADEAVAELFGASDVAVLPRGDGGTSGALVLALSMGLPVIAADMPDYAELVGDGEAGWLFAPGDAASLTQALRAAAADRDAAHVKGEAARARAEAIAWPAIAARTATLICDARARGARRPEVGTA